MVNIGNDWDGLLAGEFEKEYYKKLRAFLAEEYRTRTVYPSMYDIFNAFKYTPYHKVKAVILGQDPYHGPGQAQGLSFSVQKGKPIPPSLVNIYQELRDDLGILPPSHGCLVDWAEQGVLLLNTVLTVRARTPNSHKGKGWELFTDQVIRQKQAQPDHQPQSPDLDGGPPQPLFGLQRLFWLPPFLQVQCLFAAARRPHRLADQRMTQQGRGYG